MAGMGKFDFSELEAYHKRLKQMNAALPAFRIECIKELAARLMAKVIARTPVGPTGDLRRGWTIGEVVQTGTTYEVEIINAVDYALYVEYGHRTPDHTGWVEGRFMLTISEEELERELPALLERKHQEFMNRYLR
ncbi:HK97 gp10 family phage protein [Cohnella silvisoli]|uniref:HK97 gp10 family phage protein n=1 Tax=Cohnella silvisoli TaxID=2873699 RepID=A0ABV1L395_9BACL|nr:HK97 gp10 family phage protein [Cohnella silvisoli]MCD9026045.1 HK97 gp10 family phage protein [Cohnella silvisoli]